MSYTPPPPPGGAYSGAGAPGAYADVGPRIVAALIDYVAPAVVVWVVTLVLGAIAAELAIIGLLLYFVLIAFVIWNSGYQQGVTGQSIGKKMQNIKVVSEETGQPIGGGLGIGRYLLHMIDGICALGYIYGLFISPKKQTVADIIVKSVVVPA